MGDENKNPAAVALGSLGGSAGTGKAKRRDAEHYARISRLGGQAAKKKRQMTELQRGRARTGMIKGNAHQRRKQRRAAK